MSLTKKMNKMKKNLFYYSVVACTLLNAVTTYTVDDTNSTINTMSLSQEYLTNDVLSDPSSLSTGSTVYDYAAVNFTPAETGTYVIGQVINLDTILLLYSGNFDPNRGHCR